MIFMIEKYLEKNKVLTIYRVLENARKLKSESKKWYAEKTSRYLKISKNQALKIYLEASDLIFKNARNYFIRHTKFCPYEEFILTRICDVACIGYDKHLVNLAFRRELKKSKQIKQKFKKYLETRLKPFLSKLARNPDVLIMARRGDLVMPGRTPTSMSNINIVLITKPNFDENLLRKSPGRVEYFNFSIRGFKSTVLKENKQPYVYYDIMYLDWFIGFLNNIKKIKDESNYHYQAIKNMKIMHKKINLNIKL